VLTPFALTGSVVVLEPLSVAHVAGLAAAAAADRSTYGLTAVPDGEGGAAAYVAGVLAEQATGRALPFAVRRLADDLIVGATRYLDLDVLDPVRGKPGKQGPVPSDASPPTVAEIGGTWYAPGAQRTAVNTECKLLLLRQAFHGWGAERVSLKTDARNDRSRRAIERIGATFEGVHRVHTVAYDGTLRDTAYYSIVAAEWPAIERALTARLQA